jgi:hypothetical protein
MCHSGNGESHDKKTSGLAGLLLQVSVLIGGLVALVLLFEEYETLLNVIFGALAVVVVLSVGSFFLMRHLRDRRMLDGWQGYRTEQTRKYNEVLASRIRAQRLAEENAATSDAVAAGEIHPLELDPVPPYVPPKVIDMADEKEGQSRK